MKKNIISYGGTFLGIILFLGFKEFLIDQGCEPIWAILGSLGICVVLVALFLFVYFYVTKKK